MDQLLGQFGDSFQGVLDSAPIQLALRAIALYLALLWLAAAFWAFRDAGRRTRNLVAPYVAGAVVILATPVLFPFALLLYLIVRPGETLTEAWERQLAEEAVADASPVCAGCGRRVDGDWLACPACGQRLHHRCASCGRLTGLDWNVCAWCGVELVHREVESPIPLPVATRPQRSDAVADGTADVAAATATSVAPDAGSAARVAATRRSTGRAEGRPQRVAERSLEVGGVGSARAKDSEPGVAPTHLPLD